MHSRDLIEAALAHDQREANRALTRAGLNTADPLELRYLTEAPLSRVWSHAVDPSIAIGIITGFRGDAAGNTAAEKFQTNQIQTKALAYDIRQSGFGYFFVEGHYVEHAGQPDEQQVKETSIFVIGRPGQNDQLKELLLTLRSKYRQESVLFKPEGTANALLIFASEETSIGKLNPNKVGQFMTRLVGRPGTFVFESAYSNIGRNFLDRLGADLRLRAKLRLPGPI